jgi:hypothetical protein
MAGERHKVGGGGQLPVKIVQVEALIAVFFSLFSELFY